MDGKFRENPGAEIDAKRAQVSDSQRTPSSPPARLVGEKLLAFEEAHEIERKHVTILIADIANCTLWSEKLNSEELYRVSASCFAITLEQVSRYGGTMAQTIGGTVRAVFGAPQAFERHANRACEAALSITKLISDYSKRLREEHGLGLQMRIGLVSGLILSGSVPSGADVNYEDLEDLEDLIPTVQADLRPGTTVVATNTYKLVSNFFEFRPLKECGQQGAGQCVELYELLGARQFEGPIESKRLRGLSKFVGREAEMLILLEAVEKARKGVGQAISVIGEAGVGKSRLVFEFKNVFPSGGRTWLSGCCRSYDGAPPYHPFLDVLRLSLGIEPGDKEGSIKSKILHKLRHNADSYEEMIAPLHEILALTVEDERYLALGFQEKRRRISQAVEKVLAGEARERPLIVVLEDLHWIDPSSEELLTYLIERISGGKILLIVLYRPEYDWASRLSASIRQIRLGELVDEPMRMLTSSVLGGFQMDNGIVDLIRDKTGGNPLFIEELAMSLRESNAIHEIDGKFFLKTETHMPLMPQTIQSVIAARMDRLKKEVKTTLQVASVIGRDVPFRLLEQVRKADRNIESDIERLQQLEFIHEKVESAEREYVFKHALTQEAAYQGMSRQKRALIHGEVGDAIEEMFSERIEDFCEQLAYHFGRSGNGQKEFHYLKLSAIKASRKNSPSEAHNAVKKALRALEQQPSSTQNKKAEIEVLSLLPMLHSAMRLLGSAPPDDEEQLLARGEQLSMEIGDKDGVSFFRSSLCAHYIQTGDTISLARYSDSLINELRSGTRVLLTQDQLRVTVPLAWQHSSLCFLTGDFSGVVPVNLTILESMERSQTVFESYDMPFNAYSWIAALSAGFSAMLGDFDNAMIWAHKALTVAQEAKNSLSVAVAELWCGAVLAARGFGQQATTYLMKSIARFDEAEAPEFSHGTWFFLGHAKFLLNDLDGARQCMEKSVQMIRDLNIAYYLPYVYSYLSLAHLEAGDVMRAQDCIDSALELSQKSCQRHFEGLAKVCSGKILVESRILQAEKAEALILAGITILKEFGLKPYYAQGHLYLGELYTGTGRTRLGMKNLKKAEKMFAQMGMDYWRRRAEGALGHLQSALR